MRFSEKFRRKFMLVMVQFFFLFVVTAILINSAGATRRSRINGTWLKMGMMQDEMMQSDQVVPSCQNLPGLTPGQVRICHMYMDHMNPVSLGAKTALTECEHQFHDRRWNCSLLDDVNVLGPVLNMDFDQLETHEAEQKLLLSNKTQEVKDNENCIHYVGSIAVLLQLRELTGSRESAFAHALAAAGVAYAISRACKDGQLSSCGCSRMRRPKDLRKDWVWGGCGDNLEYGHKFTQTFVDIIEKERRYKRGTRSQGKSLMNLHNNEAGRRAVVKKSKVTCKCHGVSGSCSLITCWQQLASFREIGDYLRDKYDGATEVRVNRRGRLQLRDPRVRLPTAQDLVYMEDSPNYCIKDATIGSLGTQGRVCSRTSQDLDGCNLLCCGRGYNTLNSTIVERCDCQFKWCCQVECKTCVKSLDIHTCK